MKDIIETLCALAVIGALSLLTLLYALAPFLCLGFIAWLIFR